MKAMVLAAGLGTRFRPVTDSLPKPLVPLCNRPLVAWAIDALLDGGVDEVVVNLHHHPEPMKRWLDAEYTSRCILRYSFEPEILGTGGGLRRAREYFEREDFFFLVNGDSVQFPPWTELAASVQTTGAIASLLLRHPPSGDRFTSVWFDGSRVTAIGAAGSGKPVMFSGVHTLTPAIFDCLPDREFSGMTDDVYVPMLSRGDRAIAGVVHDGIWFDVGNPWRYLHASRELTAALARGELRAPSESTVGADASIVAHDASLQGQVSKSVAGARAVVEADALVADSALWEGAFVGAGARVESSIVGTGVRVPRGAVVRNALLWGGSVTPVDPALPVVATGL